MPEILFAMVETSYTSGLPVTSRARQGDHRQQEIIPGWSSEVEPPRQRGNYCYRAWLAGGKQRQGRLNQDARTVPVRGKKSEESKQASSSEETA